MRFFVVFGQIIPLPVPPTEAVYLLAIITPFGRIIAQKLRQSSLDYFIPYRDCTPCRYFTSVKYQARSVKVI